MDPVAVQAGTKACPSVEEASGVAAGPGTMCRSGSAGSSTTPDPTRAAPPRAVANTTATAAIAHSSVLAVRG